MDKTPIELIIFVDSIFLNNSSGINTFVKHFMGMVDKFNHLDHNRNINLNILSDDIEVLKWFIETNHVPTKYFTIDVNSEDISVKNRYNRQMHLVISFNKFIDSVKKSAKNSEYIFVTNSYFTTKILHDNMHTINKVFIKNKCFAYTHIGDIFDMSKSDVHDFERSEVDEYVKLLSTEKFKQNIKILTQTKCMMDQLSLLTNNKNIAVVEEPLYLNLNFSIVNDSVKTDEILIIAGNYKRKRYDKMIKLLSIVNKPFKILVGKKVLYYDLEALIKECNIECEYTIIENLENDFIINHILMSKMLLHVSDIEVSPYSILESASFIPAIIDNNNIWSRSFDDIGHLVNCDDYDEFKRVVDDVYNNKISSKFDLNKYTELFEKKWKEVLY